MGTAQYIFKPRASNVQERMPPPLKMKLAMPVSTLGEGANASLSEFQVNVIFSSCFSFVSIHHDMLDFIIHSVCIQHHFANIFHRG